MTALSDFLRACIADDEALARRAFAFHGSRQHAADVDYDCQECMFDAPFAPSSVLAECTAKSQIVDALDSLTGQLFATAEQAQTVENIGLALAEIYKDRPGYRTDWSPKQWYAANNATGIAAKGATREGAAAAFIDAANEYRDMLAAEEDGLNPATKALLDDLRAGRIQPDVVKEIG